MSFDDTLLSYLPAIVGNAAPVIVTSIPGLRRWNAPVLPSILGAHKTWIGFCSGALIGCIAGGLLHLFGPWTPIAALLYEQLPQSLLIGTLLGFGALFGDAVESVVKRRMGIPSGGALPVIDNIDYAVGALLFMLPFHTPSWQEAAMLILACWALSVISNLVSYSLRLKKVWY